MAQEAAESLGDGGWKGRIIEDDDDDDDACVRGRKERGWTRTRGYAGTPSAACAL